MHLLLSRTESVALRFVYKLGSDWKAGSATTDSLVLCVSACDEHVAAALQHDKRQHVGSRRTRSPSATNSSSPRVSRASPGLLDIQTRQVFRNPREGLRVGKSAPQVVFGLAEGKVKVGQLKSNKAEGRGSLGRFVGSGRQPTPQAATLYSTDSFVVSMCAGGRLTLVEDAGARSMLPLP